MARRRETRVVDAVQQWRCTSCQRWFGREAFYSSKRSPSGLKSECKKCHCITTIASRDPSKARENNKRWMRESRYARRPEVMERERRRSRVRKSTIEAKARALANRAVELGFLARPTVCPRCGSGERPVHAHHGDYSKPLDVVWLCIDCHSREHRAEATHG